MDHARRDHDVSIWLYAFGYFACYAPYSALTKAMSSGLYRGLGKVSGFAILPASTMASLVGMAVFITTMGWWKHATHSNILGVRVPRPGPRTFVSGLCSGAIIGTTTLAYTFSGVSIVFMMLLMRGGVLVLAPIVDAVSGRRVRWFSWTALLLSIGSLVAAFSRPSSFALTVVAAVDVVIYLASYFVRLRFMSHGAKSSDPDATLRYFVEEQMVATPAIVLALAIAALVGGAGIAGEIREGFTMLPRTPALLPTVIVGVLSQGTGIFGGLILLDRRENTFCVPVNRASSVLAGVVATGILAVFLGQPGLPAQEIVGAVLVVAAIAVLAVPGVIEARRKARGTAAAS
jgi:hypothetical protein